MVRNAVALWDDYSKDWLVFACLVYSQVLLNREPLENKPELAACNEFVNSLAKVKGADTIVVTTKAELKQVSYAFGYYHGVTCGGSVKPRKKKFWETEVLPIVKVTDPYCPFPQLWKSQYVAYTALMPTNLSDITAQQLLDFREENAHRQHKFFGVSDDILNEFTEATTEYGAECAVKLARSEMQDQYQKLERIYKNARIDAATKTILVAGAPAAMGHVLASALNVSCFDPLAVVATVSAAVVQILRAKEDAHQTIKDSPWGYIWEIKHLK